MPYITLHAAFDGGQTIDLTPSLIHPFGVLELRALMQNEKAQLEMQLEADDVLIDGIRHPGRARVKAKISFHEAAVVYALVRGGWLPLPFAMPPRFLADRNVVITLQKLRLGQTATNGEALRWWTKLFEQGTAMFNPLPYAMEAGYQRHPSKEEFRAAYDQGYSELATALPRCHIVKFADHNYRAAYSVLENFARRNEDEVRFLIAACPLVANRVSRQRERAVCQEIMALASRRRVPRNGFVVLAVLSCLYDDVHGIVPSIGRQIVKPTTSYGETTAFNALSDLRHIEVAAIGQAIFRSDTFALSTCDRGLASFWSALSLRAEQASDEQTITFDYDVTNDLFCRLTGHELVALGELLKR